MTRPFPKPSVPPAQKFSCPCLSPAELAVVLQIWPHLPIRAFHQPDCQEIALVTGLSDGEVRECLNGISFKRLVTADGNGGYGRKLEANCSLHLTSEEHERYPHLNVYGVYNLDSLEVREQLQAILDGTFVVGDEEPIEVGTIGGSPRLTAQIVDGEEGKGQSPFGAGGVFEEVKDVGDGRDGGVEGAQAGVDPPAAEVNPTGERTDEEVSRKKQRVVKLTPPQVEAAVIVWGAGGAPLKGHEVGKQLGFDSAKVAGILQALARHGVVQGEGARAERIYSPGTQTEFVLAKGRTSRTAPAGLKFDETYDITELAAKSGAGPTGATANPPGGGSAPAGSAEEVVAVKPLTLRERIEDLEAELERAKMDANAGFDALIVRISAIKAQLG